MQTRRQFLQQSATAMAALALPTPVFASPAPDTAFGLQLYTLRAEVTAKPAEVLQQVKKIGYACVETFGGEYSVGAKSLRGMITDAGLAVPSAHFAYDDMSKHFDYCKELGAPFIVCGSTPSKVADSADGFKRAAQQFNQWGEQARQNGLQFAFHNHNTEFERFGDVTGLDILMKETNPELVHWQPDCYWVTQAGFDPLALIQQYGNRIQTLHFKDRVPGAPTSIVTKDAFHFTEVGNGTIHWRAIWDAASAKGVKYFFVEQDKTDIPPMQSVAISYSNLKRLLA